MVSIADPALVKTLQNIIKAAKQLRKLKIEAVSQVSDFKSKDPKIWLKAWGWQQGGAHLVEK